MPSLMRLQLNPNGRTHTGIIVVRTFLNSLVLILSAYIVSWYNNTIMTMAPRELSFLLSVSVYSIFVTIATIVAPRIPKKGVFQKMTTFSPYIAIGVAFLNVILWGAGFIALAVFLTRINFCRGMICNAARADNVFAAIIFLLWTVTEGALVMDILRKPQPSGQQIAMKNVDEAEELE